MKKLNIKKELNDTLIKALAGTEKHCSYDGNKVIITGNTKRLDGRGLANSAVLDPDIFLWLKLIKRVYNVSIDHGNGYDEKTTGWVPSLACKALDNKGVEHHYFASTLIKEYPGKGNWSYNF